MSEQLAIREVIKQEFVKCATDPAYFMKKYYWIQHPKRGRIQFNLYPFQEKVLKLYSNNEYYVVNKSRQLGISTLVSAYSLWLMLFHTDKNVLVVATKQETAKNMVTKVRFAYNNLPSWLKIKTAEDNRLSLRLANGSQIKAVAASPDAGRSEAVSLLVLDEAAFIPGVDVIFTAAQQTLATGGQCIAISTPNGTGNWFHKTYTKAQLKENKFIPLSLPWTVHPERTQKWRDEQDAT
jgi:phage FluMu gp28-like protein